MCRVDHLYSFFCQWYPQACAGGDGDGVFDDDEETTGPMSVIGDSLLSGRRLVKQMTKDWEVGCSCAHYAVCCWYCSEHSTSREIIKYHVIVKVAK